MFCCLAALSHTWYHKSTPHPASRRPPPRPACLQLRSLDLSGTAANDCLLYWLAQRCCGRLQKLALGGSQVTGLGLSALLLAKRALLHHQRCAASRPSNDADAVPAPAAAAEAPAGVLALLELAAAGTAAFSAAAQHHALPAAQLQAVQVCLKGGPLAALNLSPVVLLSAVLGGLFVVGSLPFAETVGGVARRRPAPALC